MGDRHLGTFVEAGDILVGKVAPKSKNELSPEEKLLRAIFGEKAGDVRDTSLRVKPGDYGTVVEVRVFNRHGVEKDERALQIEREEVERLARDRDDELAILDRNMVAGKSATPLPESVRAVLVRGKAVEGTDNWADLPADDTVDEPYLPVQFQSRITELGMFELWCVGTQGDGQWKLEFSVREDAEE